MYYFYGNEDYLIDQEIKSIIKQNKDHVVIRTNFNNDIDEIVKQISTFNLFENNKIIIFQNFPYLINASEKEQELILDSLRSKINSTIVIFTNNKVNQKTKSNNKIVDFLKKQAICKEFNELNNKQIIQFVKEQINFHKASISEIDLIYFLSKIPNKLNLIINELDKLISLDLNISRTNIDDLVQKYNLTSIFDFINYFQANDFENIFRIYYEKLSYGESITSFINQIANNLDLCSQIYSLKKSSKSLKEMETILNKHQFVIKKCIDFLNNIGYSKIKKYLKIIENIDLSIKSGTINDKIIFERFLLEILNN